MSNTQNKTSNGLITKENVDGLISTVSNASETAVQSSQKAMAEGVKIAKEYPIHTAIGAGVVGLLAGFVGSKILK